MIQRNTEGQRTIAHTLIVFEWGGGQGNSNLLGGPGGMTAVDIQDIPKLMEAEERDDEKDNIPNSQKPYTK